MAELVNHDGIERQISALVVSGFLGSGKTTLVRWLLRQAQAAGQRVAVVSNEFGALGIDRALLGDGEEAYVELDGGCVCCELSNELRDTLQMLWQRVRPDQVIVETSGVALPADTQLTFWREPVCRWINDDVIVVVVDAEQVLRGRDLDGTFEDQVTSADLLLLNKIDMVPAAALAEVEARLRTLEPDAPIIRCCQGEVDPALLFPPDPDRVRARRSLAPRDRSSHQHDEFASEVVGIEAGVDDEVLITRVRRFGALRVKGFVQTESGLRLVQGVGARVHLTAVTVPPSRDLIGRLVVIKRVNG